MKIDQFNWTPQNGWNDELRCRLNGEAQWVLVFGATSRLTKEALVQIKAAYPCAIITGCSTAGEISGTSVLDDSIVATAVSFEHTQLAVAQVDLSNASDSRDAGAQLARQLDTHGLIHAFVISDGLKVNGSELVKGLMENLPENVSISGGLSGDGARFETTLVCCGGEIAPGRLTLVGFYGDRLCVRSASMGGWNPFGPDRRVTKASSNVLYELDGRSALELYKTYLGEHASRLPSSALLFPLTVREADSTRGVVRTILSVDENKQSMTFAGDVAEGTQARLMRASIDGLIDGAQGAAQLVRDAVKQTPELAVLISCVGRKLVLKQRVEEEVEAVSDTLGSSTVLAGFYSYGEISPFKPGAPSELHNQTMTITTFSEG